MNASKLSARTVALRALPALLWMGLIFYLSSLSHLEAPGEVERLLPLPGDVIGHVGECAVLGVLLAVAFLSTRWRWVAAFAVALLYGLSDELHQVFVPGRAASWEDILADAIGAVLGVGASWAATRLWRLGGKKPGLR
ncbi:MAG: VanZ family protein [Chloroflexi bacterium]|nr:VanZ family protein [Chloroflexota bacterium]